MMFVTFTVKSEVFEIFFTIKSEKTQAHVKLLISEQGKTIRSLPGANCYSKPLSRSASHMKF